MRIGEGVCGVSKNSEANSKPHECLKYQKTLVGPDSQGGTVMVVGVSRSRVFAVNTIKQTKRRQM